MKYQIVQSKQDFQHIKNPTFLDNLEKFTNAYTNIDTSNYTQEQNLANDINDAVFKAIRWAAPQELALPITAMKYATRGLINDSMQQNPKYIFFGDFQNPQQNVQINYPKQKKSQLLKSSYYSIEDNQRLIQPSIQYENKQHLIPPTKQFIMYNQFNERHRINESKDLQKNNLSMIKQKNELQRQKTINVDLIKNNMIKNQKKMIIHGNDNFILQNNDYKSEFGSRKVYKKAKESLVQLNQMKVNEVLKKKIKNNSQEPFVVRSTYIERMSPENIVLLTNLNPKVI